MYLINSAKYQSYGGRNVILIPSGLISPDVPFPCIPFEKFSDMNAIAVYIHVAFAQSILLQVIIGYNVHHEHTQFSKISMPIVYVSQ